MAGPDPSWPPGPDGATEADYDPGCPSMTPTYGEAGARGVLARARLRGEERFMFHCPWRDHWHVIDRPLEEMADQRFDGPRGAPDA